MADTDQTATNSMAYWRDVWERTTLATPKPKDLSFDEIVDRVVDFMVSKEEGRPQEAYGNQVGKDLEDDNDERFDPIEVLLKTEDPQKRIEILFNVKRDVDQNLDELLDRSRESLYAYYSLLVRAGLYQNSGEEMPDALREFIAQEEARPNPPKPKKPRGRPRASNHHNEYRFEAIQFANRHNLYPTRNEASEPKSACDAVATAALRLSKGEYADRFSSGYNYETLRRIWKARRAEFELLQYYPYSPWDLPDIGISKEKFGCEVDWWPSS